MECAAVREGVRRRPSLGWVAAIATGLMLLGGAVPAGAASAPTLPSTASYGGGSDPSRSQNVVALVSLKTNATASAVDVWMDLQNFNCRGNDSELLATATAVPLSQGPDGTYDFQFSSPSSDGSGSYQITGSFVNSMAQLDSASNALVEATGTVEGTSGSCAFPKLTWTAADPTSGATSGVKEKGQSYGGYFSMASRVAPVQLPVELAIAANGNGIAGVTARVNLGTVDACGQLSHFDQFWFRRHLGRSFKDVENITGPTPKPNERELFHLVWSGTFGSTKVTGTWREVGRLIDARTKKVLLTCDSGPLSWQAAN